MRALRDGNLPQLFVFEGHDPNREVYQVDQHCRHDIPSATGLLKAQKRFVAGLQQQKGYEPNALRPLGGAMATRRARSVPGEGTVNPFWSLRAQEEARVQALRPLDLPEDEGTEAVRQPVPDDDELEEERPIGDGSEEGQGTRGRSTSRTERFATPASWRQSTGLGPRTSGAMPEEVPDQGHGKTEGLLPGGPAFRLVQDQVEMDLQRMLEREVVQKLHEENLALKQQVAGMMKERGKGQGSNMESSSWSEVTATDGKDIRMDTPRRLSGDGGRGVQDRRRYTPGGTQVPLGTPPDDNMNGQNHPGDRCPPVPPWPWEHYDQEQQREMVKAWLGPVSPRVGLHDLPWSRRRDAFPARTRWTRDGIPA